jgi:Xaa-Pro aminopeptidase
MVRARSYSKKRCDLKRGWITWDKAELAPEVFETRIEHVRQVLRTHDLPALVVYTDVWRSNWGRYLSNFMPYWNRSLLIVPEEMPPILLCALSPRVYPWIRSVTILDDIRLSPSLSDSLLNICTAYSWKRLGILDIQQLPQQIYGPVMRSGLSLANISTDQNFKRNLDPNELSMWRKAVSIVRRVLEKELSEPAAETDFALAGRLERAFRRAGMEDLLLLFSDGSATPAPARGTKFTGAFSVVAAAEYRGSWVRVARTRAVASVAKQARERFDKVLRNFEQEKPDSAQVCVRDISGSYPYEYKAAGEVSQGLIFSIDVEVPMNGARLFYGDTCRLGKNGAELL